MTLPRRRFLASALTAPALLSATQSMAQDVSQQAAPPHGSFQRFFVGDIEVIALWDGYTPLPNAIITGFDADVAKAAARAAYRTFDPAATAVSINGYIIKTAGKIIAVDTGAPAAMAPTVAHWSASLALAGLTLDQIDAVFVTHMHGDHVGGLVDLKTGGATMPDAELIAAQAEWDFTFSDEVYAALPEGFRANFDFSRLAVSSYKPRFNGIAMDTETEIAPGVQAIPLPGHTPGHMGLRIHQGGEQLLIWGDAIHFAAYQFMRPDWGVLFDADVEQAVKSRRRVLGEAAADRLRVAGMHLDFPAVGYVEADNDSYRYIPSATDLRI